MRDYSGPFPAYLKLLEDGFEFELEVNLTLMQVENRASGHSRMDVSCLRRHGLMNKHRVGSAHGLDSHQSTRAFFDSAPADCGNKTRARRSEFAVFVIYLTTQEQCKIRNEHNKYRVDFPILRCALKSGRVELPFQVNTCKFCMRNNERPPSR